MLRTSHVAGISPVEIPKTELADFVPSKRHEHAAGECNSNEQQLSHVGLLPSLILDSTSRENPGRRSPACRQAGRGLRQYRDHCVQQ